MRKRNTNFSHNRQRYTQENSHSNDFAFRGSNRRAIGFNNWGYGESRDSLLPGELRERLERALTQEDSAEIREISRHFFKVNGTYSRAVYYLSWLPTYDSLVVPVVMKENVSKERIMSEFMGTLNFLEKMRLKTVFKEIALDVVVDGIYYGYLRTNAGNVVLQKLPTDFCRTKYKLNGFPVVEFDVRYFERYYHDEKIRIKVLKSFPPEVVRGYAEYRKGNVELDTHEYGAWVTLDPENAVAFYFDDLHRPLLAGSFFSIIDVLELKGVEKEKAEEQLYNLLVQKVPLTKEGEFIFDMDEAKAMHSNAAEIFRGTRKTDVLTTFADIEKLDLGESKAQPVDIEEWKKDIYRDMGVSQQLFSTEGNLALEKSLMVDETLIFYLVEKFDAWINHVINIRFNRTPTKYYFKVWLPPISNNNKMEMAKHYKDLATLGYSKFLPVVVLGQSQLTMMATASFENEILELNNVMEPLRSSHTASAKEGGGKGGRPPLPDAEKSDKTIQNQNG